MGLDRILRSGSPALLVEAEPLAARLAGTTCSDLFLDANQWAMQLQAAGKVLGARTLRVGGSPCIVAEAIGGAVDWQRDAIESPVTAPVAAPRPTPRWTALLAVLDRLIGTRGPAGVVAVLPGPARLAKALGLAPDDSGLAALKPALTALVEVVCKLRPDVLLLDEGTALPGGEPTSTYRRLLGTLRNLSRHFDVALGIGVGASDGGVIDAMARMQPELLVLTAAADGTLVNPAALAHLNKDVPLVAVPVDLQDAVGTRSRVSDARRVLAAGSWCLCTAAPLPPNLELAPARELVAELETI